MKDFINRLYQNHSLIYKVFLFIITTIAIVYLFPKGGGFGLDIQKGKIWQLDNKFAPFDFAIQKSTNEIEKEKETIENQKQLYFKYNDGVFERVKSNYLQVAATKIPDSTFENYSRRRVIRFGEQLLNKIYKDGFLENDDTKIASPKQLINIRDGNEVNQVVFDKLVNQAELKPLIDNYFDNSTYAALKPQFKAVFTDVLEPNVYFDEDFTQKSI